MIWLQIDLLLSAPKQVRIASLRETEITILDDLLKDVTSPTSESGSTLSHLS